MCCIPWCHTFCCEPQKTYTFYRVKKSKKSDHRNSEIIENFRVVSEKKAQKKETRSRDHRKKRGQPSSRQEKNRKSASLSLEENIVEHVHFPPIIPAPRPFVDLAAGFPAPPKPATVVEEQPAAAPEPEREPEPEPAAVVEENPAGAPAPDPEPTAADRDGGQSSELLQPPQSESVIVVEKKSSPPPSPTQTVVVTQEIPLSPAVVTPPDLAKFLITDSQSTIGFPNDIGEAKPTVDVPETIPEAILEVKQEDSQQEAASAKVEETDAVSPKSGPPVDVEIFATPSERRERSVSRVRSERNSPRSSSRPRSSYSSHLRDSHHSLIYEGGPRRNDSTHSLPRIPLYDRDQAVYIEKIKPRRKKLRESQGVVTKLVPGPVPEPREYSIPVYQYQKDPNYDFGRNLQNLARRAMEEDGLHARRYNENERRVNEAPEAHQRTRKAKSPSLPVVNITITKTTTRKAVNQKALPSPPHSAPPTGSQSRQIIGSKSKKCAPFIRQDSHDSYVFKEQPKVSYYYEESGSLPRTYREHRDHLSSHIVDKGLEAIIPANSNDPREIARRAEAEADRICASLGISNYATPDLTKVGLYDVIVFCDDSGSMVIDNRFKDQTSIVQRISRIAQTYNPFGISLRFINYRHDNGFNHLNHGNINNAISQVYPNGSTRIGTKLLEKVVLPFVIEPARRMQLKKPVLISIITDGEPTEEDVNTLKWTILACKNELRKFVTPQGLPYGKSAVTFQISPVSDSIESKRYLERLANDPDIGGLIFCNNEALDSAMRGADSSSEKLNTWLTQLLSGAVSM